MYMLTSNNSWQSLSHPILFSRSFLFVLIAFLILNIDGKSVFAGLVTQHSRSAYHGHVGNAPNPSGFTVSHLPVMSFPDPTVVKSSSVVRFSNTNTKLAMIKSRQDHPVGGDPGWDLIPWKQRSFSFLKISIFTFTILTITMELVRKSHRVSHSMASTQKGASSWVGGVTEVNSFWKLTKIS